MTGAAYDERLHVPLRWWAQATMLVASVWLAVVVALPEALSWLVTAIAAMIAAAVNLSYGSARIRVVGDRFHAGRAWIETRYLGAAVALDAEATRRAAGVQADARAYLLLRPYLRCSVRVQIRDPADPTPYWLISSRHPEELAAALDAAAGGPLGADRLDPRRDEPDGSDLG